MFEASASSGYADRTFCGDTPTVAPEANQVNPDLAEWRLVNPRTSAPSHSRKTTNWWDPCALRARWSHQFEEERVRYWLAKERFFILALT